MKRVRLGFTLGELLVVIVIILSLATILLPVFVGVLGVARTTTCQSNLHQLGIATQLYLSDYDDHYPYAVNALERLHPWLRFGRGKDEDPSNFRDFPSTLASYVKLGSVWRCPQDNGKTFLSGPPAYPTLFLNNGGTSYVFQELVDGQTSTSSADSGRQPLAFDGSEIWHSGLPNPTYSQSRSNVLYLDWHVKLSGPDFSH